MLVDLGLAGRSPESREPVSDTETSAAPTMSAAIPASSRYWRRFTVEAFTGEDSVIGSPLPDHEKVRRFARAQAALFQAHRHDAGLVEIALGEVHVTRPDICELV